MKTVEEDMFLAALDENTEKVEELAGMLTKTERRGVLEAFTRIQGAFQDVPAEQLEQGEN